MNQPTNCFTVEKTLWILLGIAALVMRLILLDAAPLSAPEAQEALTAWRAVNGLAAPAGSYSPSLLAVNALLFSLGGGSDRSARFWPAVCGAALAVTPYLFRRRVGRVGALAAGLYLTLSPTALFASRQVDGTTAAALGGMLCIGGLLRFLETDEEPAARRWLTLAACGLALGIASGALVYGLLVSLGLACMLLIMFGQMEWAQRAAQRLGGLMGYALLILVGVGFACATGLGWNLGGLGAVGDVLAGWLARFTSLSGVASPFALLLLYEPLGLLFGLGGWVWAIWRARRFGVWVGVWAMMGIGSLSAASGRRPLDLLWVVLPLSMLLGIVVEHFAASFPPKGERVMAGAYALFVLLLWGHAWLRLAHYALYGDPADLALLLMTVALQGILAALFALAADARLVLQAFAAGSGVMLLLMTASAGFGLSYARPSDPRELLTYQPTALETRDLERTLRELSWRRTGLPTTLPIASEAPDVVLAWYLREFPPAAEDKAEAVVTASDAPLDDLPEAAAPMEAVGQDFILCREWDAQQATCVWLKAQTDQPAGGLLGRGGLHCQPAVKWWLYRSTYLPPAASRWAVLWLRE